MIILKFCFTRRHPSPLLLAWSEWKWFTKRWDQQARKGPSHLSSSFLDWLPVFVEAWDELQKASDAIWIESIFRYCKPQAELESCGRGMSACILLASLRNHEAIYFYTWFSAQHTLKTGCWLFRHLRQVFIAISWGQIFSCPKTNFKLWMLTHGSLFLYSLSDVL